MFRMLSLAIVLLSLGQVLILHWGSLTLRDRGLSAGEFGLAIAGIGIMNGLLYPLARGRIHARGIGLAFSRIWIMGSVAALMTGLLLAAVFILVGGGGRLFVAQLGADGLRAALVWSGGLVIATGFGSVLWGSSVGNVRVQVEPVSLPYPGLPTALRQLRIAHITDLHIGPLLRPERLEGFVQRINRLEPDLVVITGDIFDFDPEYVEEGCRVLGKLEPRLASVAVLGNHDVYTGADTIAEAMKELTSIQLLRDDWMRVEHDGESLVIAGIEDPGAGWTERDCESPELDQLTSELPPDLPRLLLAHRPSYFRHAARLGFRVVLSGHTHGGQVSLPFAPEQNLSRMISRWTRGVFQLDASTLYVNRGLGMAGLPLRINCPREIALIQLDSPTP